VIFVDTSAWFASVVVNDRHHTMASAWLDGCEHKLLTTDYVIDETLTLLKARGELDHALRMGALWFSGVIAQVYKVETADIDGAWQAFCVYADKDWSFTDCVSKFVMDKLGIYQAFAFDRHFAQFGSIEVLPRLI
jgi:hypothetical protein